MRQFSVIGLSLLCLGFLLIGCQTQPEEVPSSPLQQEESRFYPDFHEWDRIDGSTATIPLTAVMVAELEGVSVEEAESLFHHNTTHYAYVNLLEGNADLIFVTAPSEEELSMAADLGIRLEVIPVVSDAFVFLTHIDNPVTGLTLEEFRDIYGGAVTNWKQVGGADAEIIPYQRPDNSGSQTLFYQHVMSKEEAMTPPIAWVETGMGGLIDAVSDYNNRDTALGYSVYYYVRNMYGVGKDFKFLAVDGVYPDDRSILSGDYPLSDAYYAVLRADTPEDSPFRVLVNWLLSQEGQAVALSAGYVADVDTPYPYEMTHQSSGTGGTVWKEDKAGKLKSGDVIRLSDLFYDGVNYIDFINRELSLQILQHHPFEGKAYYVDDAPSGIKRPFSGIPNDYTDFEVRDNHLSILFGYQEASFFGDYETYEIFLPKDLSPYGLDFEEYVFSYVLVHGWADYKPIVQKAADWGTEDSLNALIDAWYEEYLPSQSDYGPYIWRWGEYLLLTFSVQYWGDDWESPQEYLSVIFDMSQPTIVDQDQFATEWIPFDNWWTLENSAIREKDLYYGYYDLPEGYLPSEGTTYGNYRFLHDRIMMDVNDPEVGQFRVEFFFFDLLDYWQLPAKPYEVLITYNFN